MKVLPDWTHCPHVHDDPKSCWHCCQKALEDWAAQTEKVVFLILEAQRDSILSSRNLNREDQQIIADFYDEVRGWGK